MWKDFHRLPQQSKDDKPATDARKTGSDDISPLLALSALLNGDARDAAEVLGQFLPKEERPAVDAAKQARTAAEQLNTQTKKKQTYEKDSSANITDVLKAVAHSNMGKDSETAAQTDNIATQQRQMFGEIERMQNMMQKVQSGDTSALLMELLGSRIPGMENMGNMMNMINMMNNMTNN